MSAADLVDAGMTVDAHDGDRAAPTSMPVVGGNAAVLGTLIGFADDGATPLVTYPGQPGTAAIGAVAVVELHGAHIGRQVVLLFDGGSPSRPIVMGLIRRAENWPLRDRPSTVEVVADGERLTIAAQEQLVLRCGKASITLTKEGKVLLNGTYVSNRSSGVLRIKGGSVQLN